MAFQFPWTNFHELNLDWFLSKFKQFANNYLETTATVELIPTNEQPEVTVTGGSLDDDTDIVDPFSFNFKLPVTQIVGAVDSVNGQTGTVVLDKHDIGLSNVANVAQYSASNPPPYPVTSVNGQTGNVTVTAPVTSVNGQTGVVVLDKDDIGLSNVTNVAQYSASNPPPYPVTSVNGQTGDITVSAATDAQVTTAVNTWLGANVAQETGYVLDRTLSMSNAAAPADLVGDLQTALHDPEQLAEAHLVTNLINKYRAIEGKYVNHNTGDLGDNSSYYATDYIPVIPNAWYRGKNNNHYAWYDSNKTFISGASLTINTQAPATAAYIRLDYTAANANLVCMNEGVYRTEDRTFSVEYPWLVSSKKIEPERIHTYGAFYLNMFNKLTATDGVYVEHTTGERNSNASYFTSAPIPVDENTTYVMSVGNRYVAYDEHFQYISGENLNGTDKEFTTPIGAKWIRVSNTPLTVKDSLVIAEKAHYTGTYEEYSIVVPWMSPANRSKYEGKKLVCFGDSITNLGYTQFINSVTGMNAQNVGLSSGRYAYSDDSNQYVNAFALHNIVASISTGDWTIPDSINGIPGYTEQYAHIQDIKAIDFSTVDFISFAYGTNDFSSATPMDNANNKFDTNTFKGAIRYCIKTLTEKYPHLKILGVTPCYRFWSENGVIIDDSDTHEISGFKLIDYVNAIKEVFTEYHLPVLDNYTNAGINSFNRLTYFSISDGLHPNINGREIIGQRIADAIITQY